VLIDRFMPDFDVVEYHEAIVDARSADVYRTALSVDLGRSLPIQVLFAIRSVPAYLTGKRKPNRSLTIGELLQEGFVKLEEEEGSELVLGAVGRFWLPASGIESIAADEFMDFDKPGTAKAVMNIKVEERGSQTLLSTETRVLATDATARRLFGLYWKVVGPFSALIRRIMLTKIKREAETLVLS
jgi:hypothetical protein